MKKTKVVNVKHEKCDVFIGRGSEFGDPFRITKTVTRQQAVQSYRIWFPKKFPDSILKKKLKKLEGKKIGCFCKPEECHGDVLVELIHGKS